jgi:ABC-type uncharacterized transport system substrate-binding protein
MTHQKSDRHFLLVRPLRLGILLVAIWSLLPSGAQAEEKIRLVHVDSYHREYTGSWTAIQGFGDALLELGYLDTKAQIEELSKNDDVESSKAVVKRLWMDAKRKNTKPEMMQASVRLTEEIHAFKPTLMFLSDEGAPNYVGNQFLDEEIPIVFYGMKNTPVKYGLVDDPDRPGHNVTGVYAIGYYQESLELLKRLKPSAETFAILSDDGETGRSHTKAVEDVAREGRSPLRLVETVMTRRFEEWKQRALELSERVDAFYLASVNSLEHEPGQDVPREEVLRWYLTHITIPEASQAKSYVEQGILCSADFARYFQGYDAVMMAHDILSKGLNPATYPTRRARRGPLVVNRWRATMLGITLTPEMGYEEVLEEASVLKDAAVPEAKP